MPNDFESIVTWVVAVLGVWALWSSGVSVAFDKTVKPIIAFVLSYLGDEEGTSGIRPVLIVAGVFVAAAVTVVQFDYNLFAFAPRLVTQAVSNPDLQKAITALFLAAGAFGYHDGWQAYSLKREINALVEASETSD